MTQGSESLLVEKFGGTSMAHPELALAQLEYEQNAADVVVVSAMGGDEDYPGRITTMLLGYKSPSFSIDEVQRRHETFLDRSGTSNDPASIEIVERIPLDLEEWAERKDPVNALGEYWNAKLFAEYSGREFVDAREVIFFDSDGELNEDLTFAAIRSRLGGGRKYVVPGYYGSRPDGSIQTFPKGGSDITGAIIAKALGAEAYHNWSDVNGFMTADPRKVTDARLLSRITYREGRELGNGGSELLHRKVIKHLSGTGIKTLMRNTFGELGNAGTEVVDSRAWQGLPIIGVTGRDNLIALNLHEFELNEGVGKTLDVIQAIKDAGIPYLHSGDATDDVSTHIDIKYKDSVESIAKALGSKERIFQTNTAGLIHVVGEGLVVREDVAGSGSPRVWALGVVCTAFYNAGMELVGDVGLGFSATQTLFVRPGKVNEAMSIAHRALELDNI